MVRPTHLVVAGGDGGVKDQQKVTEGLALSDSGDCRKPEESERASLKPAVGDSKSGEDPLAWRTPALWWVRTLHAT